MIGMMIAVLMTLVGDPAALDLNFPTTDFGPNSPCLVTIVRVEPHDRLLVSQYAFFKPHPMRRTPKPTATNLAGLPSLLARLKPNRCLAVVDAAGNAPWSAAAPIYQALRDAGYRDFSSTDPAYLGTDPNWK